ncbi:MAG TPA: multicopper oxidase domain-containing protein [Kofleriaceae bacterium]
MTKRHPVPFARPLHPASLAKFVDTLPVPPVARSAGTAADPSRRGRTVPLYRVHMREIETQVHRDLKPTRCWSYGTGVPGPTFEARSGEPLAVEWTNDLPAKHFLPVDHTLCGADAKFPEVRTIVHVHGGRVPPESDGDPERWFARGGSRLVHYPNQQEAAGLWYHDHAMGIERLNQYAGLFGAYLLRDQVEDGLGLPGAPYEIPLFLFDRNLDEDGQLQYPTTGVPESPWVSEMYGDAILVNGKLAPDLEVERRPYRFRIFNACNARFLYLSLSGRAPLVQIGSDQGLLPRPAPQHTLTLAPAERADVIVDFGALGGQSIVLMSQSFQLMRFRVAPGPTVRGWQPPAVLREVPRTPRAQAVKTRTLAMDEYMDPVHGMLMLLGGKRWHDPVTEKPVLDSTEIWELVNYTGDTHPIHLHLVRFQVLERQRFDIDAFRYEKKMQYVGPPILPEPGELGWKDTVQAHPESITRIIVRFEQYTGRYVWHCHVLEHAANEMMRPFEVVRPGRPA